MASFWIRLSTANGPMPMLDVPPGTLDFSNTVTFSPFSAPVMAAARPAGPAAMMARSVVIFFMVRLFQ